MTDQVTVVRSSVMPWMTSLPGAILLIALYGFFATFLIALMVNRLTRTLLAKPLVLLAFVAAAFIALPYWRADTAFWNAPGWQLLVAPQILTSSGLSDRLAGLSAGFTKPLLFASPLLPFLVLFFWTNLWSSRHSLTSPKPADDDVHGSRDIGFGVLWRTQMLALVGIMVLLGLGTGYWDCSENHVMPLFFLAPIVLMILVHRSAPSATRLRYFLVLCFIVLVVSFSGRAANLIILDPICKKCYFGIPFAGLAQHIADDPTITLVFTNHRRIGGNLRPNLREDQRSIDLDWPSHFRPVEGQGAAIIVPIEASIKGYVGAAGRRGFEQTGPPELVNVPWTHAFREDGYRVNQWYVVPGSIRQSNEQANE